MNKENTKNKRSSNKRKKKSSKIDKSPSQAGNQQMKFIKGENLWLDLKRKLLKQKSTLTIILMIFMLTI